MKEKKLDLTIFANAQASKNKTALISFCILNIVFALAYLVEVIKGARTSSSYLLLLLLSLGPSIIALFTYRAKKDSKAMRYILGIGFMLWYTYVMFTATTDLTFCYVLVIICIFIVYVDMKYSILISALALVVNVAYIAKRAFTTGLTAEQVTNTEIIVACLIIFTLFMAMALNKVTRIDQANIDKAEKERENIDKMFKKTMEVLSAVLPTRPVCWH